MCLIINSSNLDPFGQHSDRDLWRVLEDVHLKEAIENSPEKLEAPVVESEYDLRMLFHDDKYLLFFIQTERI